jgi:hypothetical protein
LMERLHTDSSGFVSLSPVKSGAGVRGKFSLVGLTERAVSIHSAPDTVAEAEGVVKPAIEAH